MAEETQNFFSCTTAGGFFACLLFPRGGRRRTGEKVSNCISPPPLPQTLNWASGSLNLIYFPSRPRPLFFQNCLRKWELKSFVVCKERERERGGRGERGTNGKTLFRRPAARKGLHDQDHYMQGIIYAVCDAVQSLCMLFYFDAQSQRSAAASD